MPNKDGTGPLGQGAGSGRRSRGCPAGQGNNNNSGQGCGNGAGKGFKAGRGTLSRFFNNPNNTKNK